MNEDLRKWFKEKWVDLSRKKAGGGHPPCGASAGKGVRAKDSSKKYPKCVPANKAKSMSKKEKKSAIRRKRQVPNKPGSPDFVKTDVKKESWENWRPKSRDIYPGGAPSNNAPENPEPMAGAEAFEDSRRKVIAGLKEYIRHIVIAVLNEAEERDTGAATPSAIRTGRAAVPPPTSQETLPFKRDLEELFGKEPTSATLRGIAEIFVSILRNDDEARYAQLIDSLSEQHPEFNRAVEAMVPWLTPPGETPPRMNAARQFIIQAWSAMATSMEPIVADLHLQKLMAARPAPESKPEETGRKRTIARLDLPEQSPQFMKAVGDYRKMVQQYIDNPQQRQRILSAIEQIQFDPEVPEQMKEPMIKSMMRNVLRTRPSQLNEHLSNKVKGMIILSVLKKEGLYG